MNVKFYRPARLMSFVLAATVAFGPTAMAADSLVNEQDVQPTVVNEQDAPVVVSNLITGTALGLGTVNVLGVNVRENPTTDAEIVATLDQEQQVVVLSKDGDWYRVSCDGIYGFVHSDYMTVANAGTADLGYGLVRCLSQEDAVSITGITDGWYQVDVDGATGYVRSDLVDPTAEIPAEKIYDYAVIDVSAANLRSEPDSSAAKTDVLYNGSLCTLVQQVGDWYEVQYGDTTGYILASLVGATNNAEDGSTNVETYNDIVEREKAEAEAEAAKQQAARSSSSSSSSSGSSRSGSSSSSSSSYYEDEDDDDYDYDDDDYEDDEDDDDYYEEPSYNESSSSSIVDVALQYLGVPYVWGGTTPSGFDCSGYVQYVFRQCGYSISRTATPQYSDGTPVSYSNLQAGDLVFFERTYATDGISHVGIYIGGGEFVHAGGGCVKISSLSESYYSSRYYGACRIA